MLDKNVFNTDKTDYGQGESVFLGQPPGLFDTIHRRFPAIWTLYKEMKQLDWDENEFKFDTCNEEFKSRPPSVTKRMIATLAWQWEQDTIAARMLLPVMAQFISATELQAAWGRVTDNECLVDGTQVLTPTGWLDLSEVTPTTLVAQYNPQDRSISFTYPINYIEKDFEGELWDFSNQQGHFHQVVTPGHRMLLSMDNGTTFKVEEARDCDYGKGSANHLISGINAGFVSSHTGRQLTDVERLLIAIQADGTISDRYDGSIVGTVPVWFGFAKDRKIERLQQLANRVGWELTELTGQPSEGNRHAQRRFKLSVPIDLIDCLKNYRWVDLTTVSPQWCSDFLDEQVQWDGHFTKNTGILHTTSREAVEVCQAVASLIGRRTHLHFYPDNRSVTFSGCWRLSWKDQPYTSGQVINKQAVHYRGKVRCITVPTGFFLCRYKDAVSVTGNCIHAATYSEIVRCSFDNPDQVIKDVLAVTESLSRLKSVADIMAEVFQVSHELALGMREKDDPATYDAALLFTATNFAMERIQFMASFAVTFAIGQSNMFMPIAKAVQKICQDEFEVHVELGRAVLRNELGIDVGKASWERIRPRVVGLIRDIIQSEFAWVDYLESLDPEPLVGLTSKHMKEWVLYSAADVCRELQIKAEEVLDEGQHFPRKNPTPFMEKWVDIAKMQPAPQEQDNGQYKVNLATRTSGDRVFDVDF